MTLAIRFIPNAGRAVIYSVNRAGLPGDGYDGRYSVSGRHFDPRPSNQAYGGRRDCRSACQRPRPYQLATERDV